jgi:O-antigen/teichoic acid export membrane protein
MEGEKLPSDTEPVQPALRVARGASYLLAQGVIVNAIAVIFLAFAARKLSTVADLGRFTTLTTFAMLMVTVGAVGLPTACTRFIAKYVASTQKGQADRVYRTIMILGTGLSAAVLLVTFVGREFIASTLLGSSSYVYLVQLIAVDIFFQLLTLFPLGALQGIYAFRESAVVTISSNIFQFSVALYLLDIGLGLVGIFYGWILGDGLGAVLALVLASRRFSISTPSEHITGLMRYSMPLYGANLAGFASSYLDRFLVLFLAGTVALGIYTPAVVAAMVLGIVSVPIAGSLLPHLTEIHTQHGDEGFSNAARAASRYLFILLLPLAVGLAATAAPTLALFVGQRYTGGTVALAILALAYGLTSASVIINTSLLVLGRTTVLLLAGLLGVIGELAFAPLILVFGLDAAAVARTVLMFTSLAVSWLLLRRAVSGIVDLNAFFKVLACALIEGVAVLAVEFAIYERQLLGLYIAVGAIVYLLSLRYLRILNQDDMALLHKLFPVRLRFLVSALNWITGPSRS